ncbi:hypothetical protein FG386_003679 [Cryptosporidium ryanae]|uniref:uncharacterized protein n=1 Tax=Cryptosporidium ryanae TaxID=515981 RepID=UPI00351A2CBF|nr:hypothetical protein FG386_003679 [Cryptosporidium ryanae]
MSKYRKTLYILFILLLLNICVESQNNYWNINSVFKSMFNFDFIKNYVNLENENMYFKYRDYDSIIDYLDKLESKYNDILELSKIESKTDLKCGDKKCIYVEVKLGMYKVNDNFENKINIPNVLILSGMHGDEKIGVSVSIGLIESILSEYSKGNISVMHLLETRRIFIVPIVNPWGYFHNKRTEREIDVNRDFPSDSGVNCLISEGARIIYDLYNKYSFIFAATLHSGLKSISYGKGNRIKNEQNSLGTKELEEEEKILELIGKELQFSAGKILNNGLLENYYEKLGNIDKIVYSVNGTFEDWSLRGYGNEWSNNDYVKCNELISNNDKANKGGTLTYLIEIDDNKNPSENTLGLIEDVFKMIDLDKINLQPSHVTRNVRMLIKLIEYSKPEVLFLSKPPNTLYYGQTFRLNILVTGCYSFSNLSFKLKDKYNKELKLEFIMERKNINNNNNNNLITETHNTIYYQRCSSMIVNNKQLQESLKLDNSNDHLKSHYKNECSESNLLTKIVNRSFRVKNKCKSFYQYSRYKPISLLIKIPTEKVIVSTFDRNFDDFLFKTEIEFDKELHNIIYDSNYINNNNNNNIKYGYYWRFFESKINSDNKALKQTLNEFQIKLNRPQDIMQIKFSNCNYELNNNDNFSSEWTLICSLFYELMNYYENGKYETLNSEYLNINNQYNNNSNEHDRKRLYRNMVTSYINNIKLGFGDDSMLKNNLKIINENYHKYLIGNIYILPSDPRTSSLSINVSEISKYNKFNDTYSILSEVQDSSIMLPYFGNITLELSLRISSEKTQKGEYYFLMFSQFIKLLNRNLFKYNYLNNIIYLDNKFKEYIGVFSLPDNENLSENEYNNNYMNTIIRYINTEKLMEIISESRYKKHDLLKINKMNIEQLNNILNDYFIVIRFNKYKNKTNLSIAVGKIHFDSYLKFSLENHENETKDKNQINSEKVKKVQEKTINEDNSTNYKNEINKSYTKTHNNIRNTLFKWWKNESNNYINIRLIFIFTLILFIILAILFILSKLYGKGYRYLPLNLIKSNINNGFRSNSKVLSIDIYSPSSFNTDSECRDSGKHNYNYIKNNNSVNNIVNTNNKSINSNSNKKTLGIGDIISKGWRKKKKYDSPEIPNSPKISKSISLSRIRSYNDDKTYNSEHSKSFEFAGKEDAFSNECNSNINNSYSTLQQRYTTGSHNNINNFFHELNSFSYSVIESDSNNNNRINNNNNNMFITSEYTNRHSQNNTFNKINGSNNNSWDTSINYSNFQNYHISYKRSNSEPNAGILFLDDDQTDSDYTCEMEMIKTTNRNK